MIVGSLLLDVLLHALDVTPARATVLQACRLHMLAIQEEGQHCHGR
jgi:hypothetical protein